MKNKLLCSNYKNCPKPLCPHIVPHERHISCVDTWCDVGLKVTCGKIPFDYLMKEAINVKNNNSIPK
jgi:hypothetical protein